MPAPKGGKHEVRAKLRRGVNSCPVCNRTLFEVDERGIIKDCPKCSNTRVIFLWDDWPYDKRTTWSNDKKNIVDI